MSLSIYISNTLIPDTAIREYPKSSEALSFDGKVIPDTITFTVDNIERTEYDDRYVGSLFYGVDFYGEPVEIFDNVLGRYIFQGNLIDIEADDGAGTIKFEASNYLRNLSNTPCIYANSSDKTVAECLYEILTDANCGNISASNIVYKGFQNAINIQTANSAYVNLDFDAEKNKNCLTVINELLRMSCCYLYSRQNLIYLLQWEEYAGAIGRAVEKRHLVAGSFKQNYEDSNIYNSYSVAYDNSGTVAYSTGSNTASITKFGERKFTVPNETVDETASSKFNILYRNATGAAWAGAMILNRFTGLKKIAQFQVTDELDFVEIGEQMDLNWYPFVREPIIITSREFDKEGKTISIKGEFLNVPTEYYSRDVEPPGAPELKSVIPSGNGAVYLKWSKCFDADWSGYRVYFTTTKGEWFSDICNYGQSPIENKSTALSSDGCVYYELSQLTPGATYYFKVTAIDTSYNESEYSNVQSCYIPAAQGNIYRLAGNIATGHTLSRANSNAGTPLSAWSLFNSIAFPITLSPAAVYESPTLIGCTGLSWGASGDIVMQYKLGSTSAWSSEIDAVTNNSISVSGDTITQFRFIYNANTWGASDNFYIKELF